MPLPPPPSSSGGGSCPKGGQQPKGGTPGGSPGASASTPGTATASIDELLQTADKLIKEVVQTNDTTSLLAHCEIMLKRAYDLIVDSNEELAEENEDKFNKNKYTETSKLTIKLTKKSVEIAESFLSWTQKPSASAPIKPVYTCHKCAETADKPGKCAKCGTVLEKKLDCILKTADKCLREVVEPNDAAYLSVSSADPLNEALEIMIKCNSMLAEEKSSLMSEIIHSTGDVIKLTKKSTEMSERFLVLFRQATKLNKKPFEPEKVEEKDAAKALYVCPMDCIEPQEEYGKCPKCGMYLEKKK